MNFEAEQLAARTAASWFDIPAPDADALMGDSTGAAILALLANAGAKAVPAGPQATARYVIKTYLLRRAIRMARDWWAAPHAYGDSGYADTVVYIETPIARFSYHCKRDDPQLADLLVDHPTSTRGWSGAPLQPVAAQLAATWLGWLRSPHIDMGAVL
jgi:hypothetical protein